MPRLPQSFKRASARGFSLIESIVGVGLLGVVLVGSLQAWKMHQESLRSSATRSDKAAVGQYLLNFVDCEKTLAANAAACASNGPAQLLTEDSRELLASTGGKIGLLPVRATCSGTSLNIEVNMDLDWQHRGWQPLFAGGVPISCLAAPTPAATATATATPTATATATATATPGPPTTCVKSNLITFEEFAEGQVITDLTKVYGATFAPISGGSLVVVRIAEQGESQPGVEAWWSLLCPGKPKRNRLCNGGNSGKRALSVVNATNTKVAAFDLTFATPVSSLSFDILDMDGGENWTFTAYDINGNAFASGQGSANGYGSGSGNNGSTPFSISRAGKEIKKVRFAGSKKIKIFGFGFDNFKTDMPLCP